MFQDMQTCNEKTLLNHVWRYTTPVVLESSS